MWMIDDASNRIFIGGFQRAKVGRVLELGWWCNVHGQDRADTIRNLTMGKECTKRKFSML